MPSVPYDTSRWTNSLAEVTHQAVRFRERETRGFKPGGQAQLFLFSFSVADKLFRIVRQNAGGANYWVLRDRPLEIRREASRIERV